jgi:FAD/FMN-containing dehydrogenase
MPTPERATFLARVAAIVAPRHLLTQATDMAPYLTDWRARYSGHALGVARPGTAEEVAATVRTCLEFGVPIVPQGGNTGLCGGATPAADGSALVVQLGRLNRVRGIDPANCAMIVEAGCTLAAAREAAARAGRLFPLSLASEGSCQIGGNLATNAGGVHVLRYGMMRDLALGLEAVLPNGENWNGLNTLRKNNTGYDLRHLLIGAEGTLGIITAAALKLFPAPKNRVVVWLGVSSPQAALALLERTQIAFDARLTAFELICPLSLQLVRAHFPGAMKVKAQDTPWHVLCEFCDFGAPDGNSDLRARVEKFWSRAMDQPVTRESVGDILLAQTESQAGALWAMRENISEAQKREGVSIKHDIALPVSRIPEFLARIEPLLQRAFPGVRHTAFGHLGDGNLHFNVSHPDSSTNTDWLMPRAEAVNRLVYDLVHQLSGSISAEHGVGQLKRQILRDYKSPTEIAAMQAIKQALDPGGLMNPGKVLPARNQEIPDPRAVPSAHFSSPSHSPH